MKVVYFGTIDDQVSPRVRQLREGLRRNGVVVEECRAQGGWLSRYAQLVRQFQQVARGASVVLVSKPGQREVPLACALARSRDLPVVHDFFASLYVNDVIERRRTHERSLRAGKLHLLDASALRLADLTLVDTRAHGDLLAATFGVARARLRRVFVGAEDQFRPLPGKRCEGSLEVLYCGTFIPFHGVDVVLHAALRLARVRSLHFALLGEGQELARMKALAAELRLENVRFEVPVPYEELPERLAQADLCLGIFAQSPTARVVIPKKVFAALACARPVVTADTLGIREAVDEESAYLCEAGNPESLAATILKAADEPVRRREVAARGRALHERIFTTQAVGAALRSLLEELVAGEDGRFTGSRAAAGGES
ncbi:MAG: glycosyltransferase [Planctomycetota bacterium]